MKKLIWLILILLISSYLHAEFLESCGLKSGICLAIQNHEHDYFNYKSEYKPGFDLGFFVETKRIKALTFIAETHYIQKGNHFKYHYEELFGPTDNFNYLIRTDYLSFKLSAKLNANNLNFNPYLIFGPRIDLLLDYESENDHLDEVYDDLEKYDFGINIGLGFEFTVSPIIKGLLEINYSPNLTKSYKDEYQIINGSSFEILTGLKFE